MSNEEKRKPAQRLFGGHRNDVFRTNGFVKIVWKDGFSRRDQIREGVLLENFVATHTDIKARMLVDKSKPVQEEDGKLVSYFHFVDGEIRYPWSLDEIISAAKLLTKLHSALPKDGPLRTQRTVLSRQLHLDFARGNVLFRPGTSNAIGVIDFENTSTGPVEQELGRTLSFILVDTPVIPRSTRNLFRIKSEANYRSLIGSGMTMKERTDALLTNYGLPYRRDGVLGWSAKYLQNEDYGTLNSTRDEAMQFLSSR